MNCLILGSGGREHALAWKIQESTKIDKIYIAPGNAGTSTIGHNLSVNVSDLEAVKRLINEHEIGLLVVGPEAPLVDGLVNNLKADKDFSNLLIIGPDQAGAQLEGSKDYAKAFMQKYKVPTAQYASFTKENLDDGLQFLNTLKPPYVLKADGLAAGKGVLILEDLEEAKKELRNMLQDQKFGKASEKVVIEEFLDGIEMSVFVLTDGNDYLILPEAKDYKRIGEGDTGLNTGGMGAVSPVPFMDKHLAKKIEERVVLPTVKGLQEEKFDYKGFVFIGLMIVNNEPFVIEYNVRMGDPETEVVMPRIKSDFGEHLIACGKGDLKSQDLKLSDQYAVTVMLVSGGYPETYQKGFEITGLENSKDTMIFHAGTKLENNTVLTNGGRVLALSSMSENMQDALNHSFRMANQIQFEGKYYRKDIGKDLS